MDSIRFGLMFKQGSPGIYSWPIILSDQHQWLIWWLELKSKIICVWHFSFLRCLKYKLNSRRSEQWFNKNKWLSLSMGNEVIFSRRTNKIYHPPKWPGASSLENYFSNCVLLNRAPSSIHLHPAHFNLHLATSTSPQLIWVSTQLSKTLWYWAASPNLGQKIQSCLFWLKIGN